MTLSSLLLPSPVIAVAVGLIVTAGATVIILALDWIDRRRPR